MRPVATNKADTNSLLREDINRAVTSSPHPDISRAVISNRHQQGTNKVVTSSRSTVELHKAVIRRRVVTVVHSNLKVATEANSSHQVVTEASSSLRRRVVMEASSSSSSSLQVVMERHSKVMEVHHRGATEAHHNRVAMDRAGIQGNPNTAEMSH